MSKIIKNKKQYVIPLGNGWAVKAEGAKKLTFISDTKKEALSYAKIIAASNSADLVVYSKEGKISEVSTYIKSTGMLVKK